MRRLLLLAGLIGVCLFNIGGCDINQTGLGSCFVGNGGGNTDTSGCLGAPTNPGVDVTLGGGGFDVHTLFRHYVTTFGIPSLLNADNITIDGTMTGTDGGPTGGTAQNFGPEPSGPCGSQGVPCTGPGPGFVAVPDGIVPANWDLTWYSSLTSQNFQYLKSIGNNRSFASPDPCANSFSPFSVVPNMDIPFICDLFYGDCDCGVELAGGQGTPTTSSPTMNAGNLVDLTVNITSTYGGTFNGFTYGQVAYQIYDASANLVSCQVVYPDGSQCGYPDPVTITGPGNNEIVVPAWNLAWGDNNEPGTYYGQIQTLINGTWQNFDAFAFQIVNGGQPVYRYYSPSHGTHYFSQNVADGGSIWPYDYVFEGIGFWTYQHGVAFAPFGNALSFWRLSCCQGGGNGSWLLTTNQQEMYNAEGVGWIVGGIVGDIMPYQYQNCNNGSCYTPVTPLYRVWVQTNGNANFFYTADYSEYISTLQNGWNDQGIAGYVPTGP